MQWVDTVRSGLDQFPTSFNCHLPYALVGNDSGSCAKGGT
jgi:hypothetical protein